MRLWVEIIVLSFTVSPHFVSLFVRLWVEIQTMPLVWYTGTRQPLREAVSWNTPANCTITRICGSASSWGCELKYMISLHLRNHGRQPLREAVSWNVEPAYDPDLPFSSASSWGCELKYHGQFRRKYNIQSASSWGCEFKSPGPIRSSKVLMSASSWGCELK